MEQPANLTCDPLIECIVSALPEVDMVKVTSKNLVSPSALFNLINSNYPLSLFDIRDAQAYSESHIFKSKSIPGGSSVDLAEQIKIDLGRGFIKMVVIVCDSLDIAAEQTSALSSLLSGFSDSDMRKNSMQFVLFDTFASLYGKCSSILIKSRCTSKLTFVSNYASEILEGFLFLGDRSNGTNDNHQKDLNITHILDISGCNESETCASRLELKYMSICINDVEKEDIGQYFDSTNAFIDECKCQNGKVLVHCQGGVSRSSSLVLAYLLHSKAFPNLLAALTHVLQQRPIVCPNAGFQVQLCEYERKLYPDQQTMTAVEFNAFLCARDTPDEKDEAGTSSNFAAKLRLTVEASDAALPYNDVVNDVEDVSDCVLETNTISATCLFNMLNNCYPIAMFDIRSADAYAASQIVKSSSVPTDSPCELIQTVVESLLTSQKKLGVSYKRYVVIVCDDLSITEAITSAFTEMRNSADDSILRRINHLQFVLFGDFVNAYGNCRSMIKHHDGIELRRLVHNYASEILDGFLYLGDGLNATNDNHQKDLNITHILDISGSKLSEDCANRLGIKHMSICIWDHEAEDIGQYFDSTNAFIDECKCVNGKVLVHCRAGISRSSSLVLAYLLHSKAFPNLLAALTHVLQQRPIVCPNAGFQVQLCEYERKLYPDLPMTGVTSIQAVLTKLGTMWALNETSQSDFDRIPINAPHLRKAVILEEFPKEPVVDAKPKKPFLKKGSGTPSAKTSPSVSLKSIESPEGYTGSNKLGDAENTVDFPAKLRTRVQTADAVLVTDNSVHQEL